MSSEAGIQTAEAGIQTGADPKRWAALIVMLVAAFMNLLDVSIVKLALPGTRGHRTRSNLV